MSAESVRKRPSIHLDLLRDIVIGTGSSICDLTNNNRCICYLMGGNLPPGVVVLHGDITATPITAAVVPRHDSIPAP